MEAFWFKDRGTRMGACVCLYARSVAMKLKPRALCHGLVDRIVFGTGTVIARMAHPQPAARGRIRRLSPLLRLSMAAGSGLRGLYL